MTDNPNVKALQNAYARWHESKGARIAKAMNAVDEETPNSRAGFAIK